MAENGIKQELKTGNETEETKTDIEHTEGYKELIDYGIDQSVAEALDEIYKSGLLTPGDLDSRALDALKEFPADGGIAVLKQFKEANLEHVGNKSAYLCGVMKTYRTKRQEPAPAVKKGPDEAKLKEILERTGYQLDITTGQRKYGGPPPGWEGAQPGAGHEVFCGKIPKDVFEDELIPLFEKCGQIWDLRLMMDPFSGLNRGYCFVTFCNKEGAAEAVKQIDHHEIKKGKHLKVNVSVANLRLFVGNIPKSKSKEEILEEFSKQTEGLTDVIIYSSPDDTKKKNRGFAFLEYDSHKSASTAKRKLGSGRIRMWGCDIIVDWADPQEEPDDETMAKVKVLYVRNLKSEVTEDLLKEKFGEHGEIDRVKKIKDYGFVHFKERDDAVKAMEALNNTEICGANMEISLAKPPQDAKAKKKREQRQMMMMGGRYDDIWSPGMRGMRPPPPGMRAGMRGRGSRGMGPGYDFGYDDYYGGGYGADPYYDDYYYGFDDFEYGGFGGGGAGRGFMGGPRGRPRGMGGPPVSGRSRGRLYIRGNPRGNRW